MKIRKITTIRLKSRPNLLWLQLETEDGLKGLGEIWRGTSAVEAVIHDDMASWLFTQDPDDIELISRTFTTPYVGYHSSSAETRAASAVDIALWDLKGKRLGTPVYNLLGGRSRENIPVYNTCSGYSFNASAGNFNSGSSRRIITDKDRSVGPYDDQIAFMRDAGALAESLVSEGYSAMKIWPFDTYAKKSGGYRISLEELKEGLIPFKKIRERVGDKIEVMCELHNLWSLPAAERIMEGLKEYDIFWAEDPLCKMDDIKGVRALKEKAQVPICGCESIGSSVTFRQLLEEHCFDYLMMDLGWCGGITEARKTAYLAESYNIPVSPHDCTGPVLLMAGLHLGLHAGNAIFQEVVRANLDSWYPEMVTVLPDIKDGHASLSDAPGLGTELRPEVFEREDALIRVSEA